jgi:hypothetical protein
MIRWHRRRFVVGVLVVYTSVCGLVSSHPVESSQDYVEAITLTDSLMDTSTSQAVEVVEFWPLDGTDWTKRSGDDENSETTSRSCSSHADCNECTASSSLCHWCDGDKKCHEIGSIHGCSWGSTCSSSPTKKNSTDDDDDTGGGSHNSSSSGDTSCASLGSCAACYDTYTCHWCDNDQACHARGSVHGCTIGSTCKTKPDVKPKENTTCASHSTCAECALASRLCHWCEYDNACHAVGSKYGCVTGVDCYSNDRCRRPDPEKFEEFILTEMPRDKMMYLLVVALLLCGCTTCCFCFCCGNIKGAYDDLATISVAASRAPPSVIGGTTSSLMGRTVEDTTEAFNTSLETHDEEEEQDDQDDEEEAILDPCDENDQEPANCEEQGNGIEGDYTLMDEHPSREKAPLLPPRQYQQYYVNSGDESVVPAPIHMNRLYKACAFCYWLTILLLVSLVGTCIYFYPKRPVYDVCNDSVAWKKIIENIASLKLDASFEILVSLSNPNRFDVAVDNASGGFSFEGKRVGTFIIPPLTAASMAITDLMLIAHVTPDKYQAFQLAEAFYKGKLILIADFEATLRVPALRNLTKQVSVDSIIVNVTEVTDRSLCACSTWDEKPRDTIMLLPDSHVPLF